MAQLERENWKPRDLVRATSDKSLGNLEDRVESALRTHRHGYIQKMQGTVPVYEAAPIDTTKWPIRYTLNGDTYESDPLNAVNKTIADHMKDATLHQVNALNADQYQIYNGYIDLLKPVALNPDFEDGSIVQSAYEAGQSMRLVKPKHNSFTQVYAPAGGGSWQQAVTANIWKAYMQGAQQSFTNPIPFRKSAPLFGRVLQQGTYQFTNQWEFNDLGGSPNLIAFDYMIWPMRTWFNMFRQNFSIYFGMQFTKTVLWRRRVGPFPAGYRVPISKVEQVQLYHQLRFKLANSYRPSDRFDKVYWPKDGTTVKDDGTPLGTYPATVPTPTQYTLDPGNHQRSFVPDAADALTSPYLQRVGLFPDFAHYKRANAGLGGMIKDVWEDFKNWGIATYNPDGEDGSVNNYYPHQDYWMPLNDQDVPSMRVLYKMVNDNQMDIWPFINNGFITFFPYGYLPLYVPDDAFIYIPNYIHNPISRTAAMYLRTKLEFAPEGSTISFEEEGIGATTVKVPRAVVPSGADEYSYPYPTELGLDYKILIHK